MRGRPFGSSTGPCLLVCGLAIQSCAVDPGLEEQGTECGDGIDNDGDGLWDCADESCRDAPTCMGCTFELRDGAIVDSCRGDVICVCPGGIDAECADTGLCEYAYGHTYQIRVLVLGLPDRDPDGACWDEPGCGAPDPFVEFIVDGMSYGTTPSFPDVFETAVGYEVFAPLNFGSTIELRVVDEDTFASDAAFSCTKTDIDASYLRGRGMVCSGDLGTIIASIFPL